jgi:hypothetical protein
VVAMPELMNVRRFMVRILPWPGRKATQILRELKAGAIFLRMTRAPDPRIFHKECAAHGHSNGCVRHLHGGNTKKRRRELGAAFGRIVTTMNAGRR